MTGFFGHIKPRPFTNNSCRSLYIVASIRSSSTQEGRRIVTPHYGRENRKVQTGDPAGKSHFLIKNIQDGYLEHKSNFDVAS